MCRVCTCDVISFAWREEELENAALVFYHELHDLMIAFIWTFAFIIEYEPVELDGFFLICSRLLGAKCSSVLHE